MNKEIIDQIEEAKSRHKIIKSEISKIMSDKVSGKIDDGIYDQKIHELRKELGNILFKISYLENMMEGEDNDRHKTNKRK